MELMQKPYIVYVKVNSAGYITAVNSSAFLTDTTEWIEIDSGFGEKYGHAQGNYFPQPIRMDVGSYRYKMVDGKPMECAAEEQAQKVPVPAKKTIEERIHTLEKGASEIKDLLSALMGKNIP